MRRATRQANSEAGDCPGNGAVSVARI
jgi:hypothetical protein